jgi:hypothetical protein
LNFISEIFQGESEKAKRRTHAIDKTYCAVNLSAGSSVHGLFDGFYRFCTHGDANFALVFPLELLALELNQSQSLGSKK